MKSSDKGLQIQALIQSKGGIVLTPFTNMTKKIRIRCYYNHEWDVAPSNINLGRWCPHCSGRGTRESKAEELEQIIKHKGGVLLTNYISLTKPIRVRCHLGHEWETAASNIKQGAWCHWCSGYNKDYISSLQVIATSKGGQLLSTSYEHAHAKLTWKCSEGHLWDASSNNVQSGKWCPQCNGGVRYTREYISSLAEARGGQLLSQTYNNRDEILQWRCRNGHIWDNSANMIIKGAWCKDCTNDEIIKEAFEQVAKKQGKFLGPRFTKASDKYKWECIMGHVWEATMSNIKGGRWCPSCKQSKGEFECIQALQKLSIPYQRESKFHELGALRFDFTFNYNNVLWFLEFDGIQHFDPDRMSYYDNNFVEARKRDIIKSQFATIKGNLIRIHYSDVKNVEQHLIAAFRLNLKVYYSKPVEYSWLDSEFSNMIITNARYKPMRLIVNA